MGQPRYDILARANEIYDKNKIISDLGLIRIKDHSLVHPDAWSVS